MTYRLYNRIGSGGFAVEAAFALAGHPVELRDLDSRASTPLPDSFRETNPWGQVPVLTLPDGTCVTETGAILIHLGNVFEGQGQSEGLTPQPGTSDHAAYLRWIVFASVNLYEAVLRRGYSWRYTTDPDGTDAISAAAQLRMQEAVMVVEDAIEPGPFLLGETMSLADIYIAMLFSWLRGDVETPRLVALTDKVRSHPVIAPIWERHFGS